MSNIFFIIENTSTIDIPMYEVEGLYTIGDKENVRKCLLQNNICYHNHYYDHYDYTLTT